MAPTANPAQAALMGEAHAPTYAPSIETTAVSPLLVFQPISTSEELGLLAPVAVNAPETVSFTIAYNENVTISDDESLLETVLDNNTADGGVFEHAAQGGASETQDALLHDEWLVIDTANDGVSTNAIQSYLGRGRNRGYNNNTDGEDNDDDVLIDESGSEYFPSSPMKDTFQPEWPTHWVLWSSAEERGVRCVEEPELPRYHLLRGARVLTFVESLVASFPVYDRLMTASADSDYSTIFERLKYEWSLSVDSLQKVAVVGMFIFAGIRGGTIFGVKPNSIMETALSVSSATSVIGALCGAWYINRYDARNIKDRALDVFGLYLFFSVSCRVPGLCHLVSTFSMLVFFFSVAYNLSPSVALACCGIPGALMTPQYSVCALVFVTHVTWDAMRRLFDRIVSLTATTIHHHSNHK